MSQKRHTNTLAQLRTKRGLSQEEAARLVSCTTQEIADYEHDRLQPQLRRAMSLSVAYAKGPRSPVPLAQLFPELFTRVHAKTEAQKKALARVRRQQHYETKVNTDTILSLYGGRTWNIGMAVFEAAQTD